MVYSVVYCCVDYCCFIIVGVSVKVFMNMVKYNYGIVD